MVLGPAAGRLSFVDNDYARFIVMTLPDGLVHYTVGTLVEGTSAVGLAISRNKFATYGIAANLGVPVADYIMYDDTKIDEVVAFCEQQWQAGHQLVVKPTNCDHGIGITVGVKSKSELDVAVAYAQNFTKKIVIQRRHFGSDCRVTVVGGVGVAAARRVPPSVVGDGVHTVAELIDQENIRRQSVSHDERQILKPIRSSVAQRFLGLEVMDSVPEPGKNIAVSGAANFGRGGTVEDITDVIHPSFMEAGVRLAEAIGLKVCGVDFLTSDCTQPISADTTILLEINCSIGLRLHHYPNVGEPRDVAGAILDVIANEELI
jgi:cyanophycin synthetase